MLGLLLQCHRLVRWMLTFVAKYAHPKPSFPHSAATATPSLRNGEKGTIDKGASDVAGGGCSTGQAIGIGKDGSYF